MKELINELKIIKLRWWAALACSVALGFIAMALNGCATLAPGADPLVVRAEQLEQEGSAMFTLILQIDNANRPFFMTNAPGYHAFCEWLRQPVVIDGTNTLQRDLAMPVQLDDIKRTYKLAHTTTSSNMLATSLITFQAAVTQASSWATVITNKN